ncbi:MAG: hypothetical protein AAF557_00025 [Pseudomonadota bacterium]
MKLYKALIALQFVLVPSLAISNPSFQKFSEYRIPASIVERVVIGSFEVEDPVPLEIYLKAHNEPLVIETDGFAEECKDKIERAMGSDPENALGSETIQITVYETAQTLNGVLITECVRIFQ